MTKNLLLAGCLLSLAASANASKAYDCRHFDRGHEIISNITERFYGRTVAKEQLHAWVLKLTRDDANTAVNASAATLTPSGEGCSGVVSAQAAMAAKYKEVIRLADLAIPPCTTYPNKTEEVPLCEAKTRPLFKADDEAGLLMGKFVEAVKANPSCSSLEMNDAAKTDADTVEAVFIRLQRKSCKRDDRCHMVRIGKLREARGELHKIEAKDKDEAPAELLGAWHAAKPLLFNARGKADNTSLPSDGAENILWHMEVWNDHYGGTSDDDTNLIFVASGKIALAQTILRPARCPE
jgi:hypothetical protein